MTFIDACWTFKETKERMCEQRGCGWYVSAVATVVWDSGHVSGGPAQLSAVVDFLEAGQTINYDRYSTTRIPWVRPEKKTTSLLEHDNARPHTSLKTMEHVANLAGLPYHIYRIVRIWRHLTTICLGRWKIDCTGNIFLSTMQSSQLWKRGSPRLVQTFTSQWWWLCGTIVFSNRILALSNGIVVHPLSVVISVEIKRRHYFWSSMIIKKSSQCEQCSEHLCRGLVIGTRSQKDRHMKGWTNIPYT
jgi:hypothetical protein